MQLGLLSRCIGHTLKRGYRKHGYRPNGPIVVFLRTIVAF